jgi:hypothetical protein
MRGDRNPELRIIVEADPSSTSTLLPKEHLARLGHRYAMFAACFVNGYRKA